MTADLRAPERRPRWPWRCPDCGRPLAGDGTDDPGPSASDADIGPCPACGRRFQRLEGLADLRPLDSQTLLERFAADYAAVRLAEGRGAISLGDLRALPWPGPRTPMAWEWLIRSASYEAFLDAVLRPLLDLRAAPRVLDLGAGVGWLSHRLAWEGCHALALDACAHPLVGLGAARGFLEAGSVAASEGRAAPGTISLVLGDFNRVPLADASVDLVLFNASLHYGADLVSILAEAERLLLPHGRIAVIDSPFYDDPAAGRAMVDAQRTALSRLGGRASDAQDGMGFLTRRGLSSAGSIVGLRWHYVEPRRGWRWRLRRSWRRLRLGRESADFPVALAERA